MFDMFPSRGKFIGLHHRVEDEVVHVKRGYFKSPLFQQPSLSVWRGELIGLAFLPLFCSIICAVCWQLLPAPPKSWRFLTGSQPDPGCSLHRVLFRSAPQTWRRRGRLSHPWTFQKQIPSAPLASNTVPSLGWSTGVFGQALHKGNPIVNKHQHSEIKGMAWGMPLDSHDMIIS